MLVSIDPGTNTGWAKWHDGVLVDCGLIDLSKQKSLEDRASVLAHCLRQALPGMTQTDLIVLEHMKIYPAARQKGDPNDLIMVAVLEGVVLEALAGYARLVEPHEWKGQVPKDIMQGRIAVELAPAEHAVIKAKLGKTPKSKSHNVYDAIGIGLWFLARLGRNKPVTLKPMKLIEI